MIFWDILRQYKSLYFFFNFCFRKQVWTFTFPQIFSFAISHPYLETILQPQKLYYRTILQPHIPVLEPQKAVLQPDNTLLRPHKTLLQLHKTVLQPHKIVLQPNKTVLHLHENVLRKKMSALKLYYNIKTWLNSTWIY